MIIINTTRSLRRGPPPSQPMPPHLVGQVQRGIDLLMTRILGCESCEQEFRTLPRGLSFTQIVNLGVYVNYHPANNTDWGWMDTGYPQDIVLTPLAIRMGRWAIAGTIVHEIAHLNGAPGGNDHAAEHTLSKCRLMSQNGPYDRNIVG
ncbi:hypothetical protein [Chondromyces apiculatus]|uniref:Tox-MPTase3 domain-containing protein n=1 Tax=Chondromyces apiculatus DSM 436 TaxID=1192034 RepID=A0A017SWY3_9BACT|nr:hypothetical protein [Chondromyces apiculatus]EYF01090.1 Hypothetical protein CAP_8648 [Chondromyces apiculatus DSM 436]